MDANIEGSHLRGLPFDHCLSSFMESGSVLLRKGAGRLKISKEKIKSALAADLKRPRKSIYKASAQLQKLHCFMKFCMRVGDFTHTKCSNYKPSS